MKSAAHSPQTLHPPASREPPTLHSHGCIKNLSFKFVQLPSGFTRYRKMALQLAAISLHKSTAAKHLHQAQTHGLPQGHRPWQNGEASIPNDAYGSVIPQGEHFVIFAIGDFQLRQPVTSAPLMNSFLILNVTGTSGEDFDGAAGFDPMLHPFKHVRHGQTNAMRLGVGICDCQGAIEIHSDPTSPGIFWMFEQLLVMPLNFQHYSYSNLQVIS